VGFEEAESAVGFLNASQLQALLGSVHLIWQLLNVEFKVYSFNSLKFSSNTFCLNYLKMMLDKSKF
jgi:hypothetical protein